MSITKFGSNLKVSEALPKEFQSERELFINIVNNLEKSNETDNVLFDNFGIDVLDFQLPLHNVIQNLFLLKYGQTKTDIIMWYLFNRSIEHDKTIPLILINDEDDEDEDEELILNNAGELYDYINKLKPEDKNY